MTSKYALIAVLILVFGGGIVYFSRTKTPTARNSTPAASSSSVAAAPNTIMIKGYAYNPPSITVKSGTVVTWVNEDIARHTVTADTPSGDAPASAFFGQNEKYTFTAGAPGTYTYHCEPHPYMKATIIVTQ